MLTTTLPFDDFFAGSSEAENQDDWLETLADALFPLTLTAAVVSNRKRQVIFKYGNAKRLLKCLDENEQSLKFESSIVIEHSGRDVILLCQDDVEASEMDASTLLLSLQGEDEDGEGLKEAVEEKSRLLKSVTRLTLRAARHEQRVEILRARTNQLSRQHTVFRAEHQRILEDTLKERDARIKEQRTYTQRLEREVALRTMEIHDQAAELRQANQRMTRTLQSAARIQSALLPKTLPERGTVQFAWKFQPCDELAGDSLNVFNLDENHVGVYVLDVSGHGVPSALLSVTLSKFLMPVTGDTSLLKSPCDEAPHYRLTPPNEVAKRLNVLFPMTETTEQYFTILYGILNLKTRQFRYVSAGHPGLVYQPAEGEPQLRETESFAIGWFDDVEYEEHTLQLSPGDRVFIYSDGITESANNSSEAFGNDRLLETVGKNKGVELQQGTNNLLNEVIAWTGQRSPQDDLSIVGFEIKG